MKLRILVADDQIVIRKLLSQLFIEKGWSLIAEACDGQEAIAEYMRHRPDVVLMDLSMPVLDGLNALKAIKRFDPDATVIMLSSIGQQDKIEAAIDLGAAAYILKPIKKEELSRAISVFSPPR